MTQVTGAHASAVPSAEEKPPPVAPQGPADSRLCRGQPPGATRKRLPKIPGLAPSTFSARLYLCRHGFRGLLFLSQSETNESPRTRFGRSGAQTSTIMTKHLRRGCSKGMTLLPSMGLRNRKPNRTRRKEPGFNCREQACPYTRGHSHRGSAGRP